MNWFDVHPEAESAAKILYATAPVPCGDEIPVHDNQWSL